LDAIEQQGYNTLERRPAIGGLQRLSLLGRAATATVIAMIAPGARPEQNYSAAPGGAASASSARRDPASIEASYAECRRVARRAASNFYYAFFMLPRAKRDALCALYAFMRLVDDVSDDDASAARTPENLAARRASLARWRNLLDQTVAGEPAQHPILPAFADTIERYQIPARYFHDLISGAEMDLTEARYATFERLQEYCYRVAGTVGLTCLCVFGSDNPHAPELAERLGIAFQLTNILRDVGSDLAMGRIYLPAEDLARGVVTPPVRELFRLQADRAWRFYAEGAQLLGRVHPDSRAALWALIRIYSGLLARIEERDFDVFSSRVRLTAAEKAGVLLRARLGLWSETDVLEERNRDRRRAGGTFFRRRAG
jgi:phytoene synthase